MGNRRSGNADELKCLCSDEDEVDTSSSMNSDKDDNETLPRHEEQESQNNEDSDKNPKLNFKTVSSLAIFSKWWKGYAQEKKQKKTDRAEEQRMRFKLQYHFMSPYKKYKMGRRPWKLAIQILKIFIVTTQVVLFQTDRFAVIQFMKNTEKTFKHLFVSEYDGTTGFSYYSRTDLVTAIQFAQNEYQMSPVEAVGKFWHSKKPNGDIWPILLCEVTYQQDGDTIYIDDKNDITKCQELTSKTNLSRILHYKHYFDRVKTIKIKFQMKTIYLNGLKLHHQPECLITDNMITIDNSKHDGRLRVSFSMVQDIMSHCSKTYKVSEDAKTIRMVFIAFDLLVIGICSFSILLCIRSVLKSVKLAKAAQRYFKVYRQETFTKWDLFELVNKWFAVIVLSDLLSIIGSIYKIYVDDRDIQYYNKCSVFLGLGVVMVWIGLLRFFTYLKKYNILLITLRTAAPSLLRFMFCAMFMFFGFTFCGWVVLGPYHKKFATFLRTAECLFSLLNGDDMFPTFQQMSKSSLAIWIFSKIYLYAFISFFIYVVLSTFISIVGDTYERLKDWGHMPLTKIEKFMVGTRTSGKWNKSLSKHFCQRCARETQSSEHQASTSYRSMYGSLEDSCLSDRMSIMSASLE